MKKFLSRALPFWQDLTEEQQQLFVEHTQKKAFKQGVVLYNAGADNAGLKIVETGQIRIFISTSAGGEVTMYRVPAGSICVMSVICMTKAVDIQINVEAEKDSTVYIIPAEAFHRVHGENSAVKDFTQRILSERIADIMSILGNMVSMPVGKRLADNLLNRMRLEGSREILTTHEALAHDIGSAREVVSRILKQFQSLGLVRLSRGKVYILDEDGLKGR